MLLTCSVVTCGLLMWCSGVTQEREEDEFMLVSSTPTKASGQRSASPDTIIASPGTLTSATSSPDRAHTATDDCESGASDGRWDESSGFVDASSFFDGQDDQDSPVQDAGRKSGRFVRATRRELHASASSTSQGRLRNVQSRRAPSLRDRIFRQHICSQRIVRNDTLPLGTDVHAPRFLDAEH